MADHRRANGGRVPHGATVQGAAVWTYSFTACLSRPLVNGSPGSNPGRSPPAVPPHIGARTFVCWPAVVIAAVALAFASLAFADGANSAGVRGVWVLAAGSPLGTAAAAVANGIGCTARMRALAGSKGPTVAALSSGRHAHSSLLAPRWLPRTCTAPMPPSLHPTCTHASPARMPSPHTPPGPVEALGHPHSPGNRPPNGYLYGTLGRPLAARRCQGGLAPQIRRGRAAGCGMPVARCWAPLATVRPASGHQVPAHHPN